MYNRCQSCHDTGDILICGYVRCGGETKIGNFLLKFFSVYVLEITMCDTW